MKKKAKGHAMLHHSCFQDYYPQILEKIISLDNEFDVSKITIAEKDLIEK